MAATFIGLLLGVILSALSCFVRPLRRLVPYLLLTPFCAAVGIVLLGYLFWVHLPPGQYSLPDDFLRFFFSVGIGGFASWLFGALLGAVGGFCFARFLSRRLNHLTMRSSELPSADAAGSRSPER